MSAIPVTSTAYNLGVPLNRGYATEQYGDGWSSWGSPKVLGLVDKAKFLVISGKYCAMTLIFMKNIRGEPVVKSCTPSQCSPQQYTSETLRHTIFVEREAFKLQPGQVVELTKEDCNYGGLSALSCSSMSEALQQCVSYNMLNSEKFPVALHAITVKKAGYDPRPLVAPRPGHSSILPSRL